MSTRTYAELAAELGRLNYELAMRKIKLATLCVRRAPRHLLVSLEEVIIQARQYPLDDCNKFQIDNIIWSYPPEAKDLKVLDE